MIKLNEILEAYLSMVVINFWSNLKLGVLLERWYLRNSRLCNTNEIFKNVGKKIILRLLTSVSWLKQNRITIYFRFFQTHFLVWAGLPLFLDFPYMWKEKEYIRNPLLTLVYRLFPPSAIHLTGQRIQEALFSPPSSVGRSTAWWNSGPSRALVLLN